MQEFIDLEGASGATYRFRAWPENGVHLPMAGNYVFVRRTEEGRWTVVLAGVSMDLSRIEVPKRRRSLGGAALFTRLNVARAVRESEHQDLVERYRCASVDPE